MDVKCHIENELIAPWKWLLVSFVVETHETLNRQSKTRAAYIRGSLGRAACKPYVSVVRWPQRWRCWSYFLWRIQGSKKKCCRCQADLTVFPGEVRSEKLLPGNLTASWESVDFGCPFALAWLLRSVCCHYGGSDVLPLYSLSPLEWNCWSGLAGGAEEAAVPLWALNFAAASMVLKGFWWGSLVGSVLQSGYTRLLNLDENALYLWHSCP